MKTIKLFYLILFLSQTSYAQIGNVLVMDGCTNYMEIQDNDLLDFEGIISIEAWVKPNCGDANNIIVSKQWCQRDYGYYLSVNRGKLFWTYSFTGSCGTPNFFESVDSLIPTDRFTHVAVMHNQNEIKLFVDGREVEGRLAGGAFGPMINSSQPFRIGVYYGLSRNYGAFYSGLLDEIRVWNTELTESLIQSRKDIPLNGDEEDLVLYLDMEDTGQGASLNIENKSILGNSLNPTTDGFTLETPYIIVPENYNDNPLDLGFDILTCESSFILSLDSENYKSINWSTGETGQAININTSGIYSVIVETELCKFFEDQIIVEFIDQSFINQDFTLCENDTLILNNKIYFEEGIYLDTISASFGGCDTIYEYTIFSAPSQTEALVFETCPNSTVFYNNEALVAGSITPFIFSNSNGCDSIIIVEITATQVIREEINFDACSGEPILYNGNTLLPNTSTIFNFISAEGCDSILTVHVRENELVTNFLGLDQITCDPMFILRSPFENTIWDDGTISNDLTVTMSGTYIATIVDSTGCSSSDSITIDFVEAEIFIPNTFSPNGDGINDCFQAYYPNAIQYEAYNLSIYNRWGGLIFETNNIDHCWDGTFNGKQLTPDVFVWIIKTVNNSCNKSGLLTGDVTLLK